MEKYKGLENALNSVLDKVAEMDRQKEYLIDATSEEMSLCCDDKIINGRCVECLEGVN